MNALPLDDFIKELSASQIASITNELSDEGQRVISDKVLTLSGNGGIDSKKADEIQKSIRDESDDFLVKHGFKDLTGKVDHEKLAKFLKNSNSSDAAKIIAQLSDEDATLLFCLLHR